ncbi:hypothetical protein ACFYTF_00085 [Nocardia thailandica]|uniref:RAMA domain-containing protein n=1 Tax=Nocardia thailandica TaxID=257275 RepID=A0ABW6PFP8_9NOCA
MEHTISIDDEVYQALVRNRRGFEQPNDVLRRVLFLEGGEPEVVAAEPPTVQVGRLSMLLDAGLIEVGDQLSHRRVRKGQVLEAEVAAGGAIRTSRGIYAAPSPALGDLVGTAIDGWHNWIHVRSGKSLRELRSSLVGANVTSK